MLQETNNEQAPAIYGPAARPSGQRGSKNIELSRSLTPATSKRKRVSERINDVEAVQQEILQRMNEQLKQYSGAYDYYHQSTPTSISPNVLDQLYGRDLNYLRQYYEKNSPIDQLIFGKRFDQLRLLSDCIGDSKEKIGWRVVHKKQDSQDFRVTKDIEKKCRWFEENLIQNPNAIRHPGGFPDALIAMAESKMLFDRIPIEKFEHFQKPGTGIPGGYLIPDSATIKPTTWVLHAMAGSSAYSGRSNINQAQMITQDSMSTANQMLTYDDKSMDMATKIAAKQISKGNTYKYESEYYRLKSGVIVWVQQMPDRQIAAAYTDKDLSMFIGNPSPKVNAWGWSSGSAFERSFAFGDVIFKMTGFNSEIFDSKMPEGILAFQGAGMDKRGKQQFHDRMLEEGSDRYNNMLAMALNDPERDVKYIPMKNKPNEMQFKEMFTLYVKLKCSAYGFDYTELNLEDGKSGGLGGSGANEKRMDLAAASGIHSDTKYYAHCLTKALIEPWSDEYKMEFVHDVSETKEHIEIVKDKMAYTSVNEARVSENLDGDWAKKAPEQYQENLEKLGQFLYLPGVSDTGRTQLMVKQMDLDMQEKMQEQAQEEEANQQEGEGQPEEEAPEELKESQEISDLKSAIGQTEKENKELEVMEKSFAVKVEHVYS